MFIQQLEQYNVYCNTKFLTNPLDPHPSSGSSTVIDVSSTNPFKTFFIYHTRSVVYPPAGEAVLRDYFPTAGNFPRNSIFKSSMMDDSTIPVEY